MSKEAEQQTEEEVIVDEVEESTEEVIETEENSSTEAQEETSEEPAEDDDSVADEVVVTIGDDAPPQEDEQKAPSWVKELRKSHRETQRENRELKAQLEAANKPVNEQVTIGPKPKLEDHDYDTEKYEQELTAWYDRKRKHDEQTSQREAEAEAQQKAWQERLDTYGEKKGKLKVRDFEDAEAAVLENFDQTQQGIVIQGAEDAAVTFYALGKNPGKLKELASIKDPVKFAFAVAKLETQLKVKNRKAPPPPEKMVNGTAPKSGAVDSNLERLREEASRTGNYSKVHAYKQQKKLKAKG